jgi:hypothetical protein
MSDNDNSNNEAVGIPVRRKPKAQMEKPALEQSEHKNTSEGESETSDKKSVANSEKEAVSPIKQTNIWTFALSTGFFAGVIWGGIRIAEYYFKFTKVHPTFLIKPWSTPAFNQTTLGYMTGWAAFVVFSIVAALLYALCFRKVRGPWLGMVYGLVWWVIIYVAAGPPTGMMKPIGAIGWNSLITDGCLFLLWGFFIGFTIEFEFNDEQEREPSVSLGQA